MSTYSKSHPLGLDAQYFHLFLMTALHFPLGNCLHPSHGSGGMANHSPLFQSLTVSLKPDQPETTRNEPIVWGNQISCLQAVRCGTPEDLRKEGSCLARFGFLLKDSKEGWREARISSGLDAVLDEGLRRARIEHCHEARAAELLVIPSIRSEKQSMPLPLSLVIGKRAVATCRGSLQHFTATTWLREEQCFFPAL